MCTRMALEALKAFHVKCFPLFFLMDGALRRNGSFIRILLDTLQKSNREKVSEALKVSTFHCFNDSY